MRKWIVFFGVGLLMPSFAYADLATTTSSGATVTYSASTDLICPANSTLQDKMCYCNSGFRVGGTACIKDEAMPPGALDIYEDVRVQAAFNDDMSCEQMGIVGTVDLDMCKRFLATPTDKRSEWKTI